MKSTRRLVAVLAIAGAVTLSAVGVAIAGSNGDVKPADRPGGAVTGSVERAPTAGYDEIVLGE